MGLFAHAVRQFYGLCPNLGRYKPQAVAGAQEGCGRLQALKQISNMRFAALAPCSIGAGYCQQYVCTFVAYALPHSLPVGARHLHLQAQRQCQQLVGGFVNFKVFGKGHFYATALRAVKVFKRESGKGESGGLHALCARSP